jgi:integrase/recombinase XerD
MIERLKKRTIGGTMKADIMLYEGPRDLAAVTARRPALFLAEPQAAGRFWEFFTVNIRNRHTRRAYYTAVCRFSAWCERRGLDALAHVKPMHVAAFIEELGQTRSKPTVKQHLAALRMLCDWLVVGHVMDVNPAHAVRGPTHRVKTGKTPVLTAEEARALLDSITVVKTVKRPDGTEAEMPCVVGLRDRALIALMIYTFARIGAATGMKVEDYYIQGRRGWVRLHEKGGKRHELPTHHTLDAYLEAYVQGACLETDPKGPLFRAAAGKADALKPRPMRQADAYRMIRRRAEAAGIRTKIGCHTFRATGITAYLRNGGRLEVAQQMAAHESPRTTGLYDRRGDDVSLDEVEKIAI